MKSFWVVCESILEALYLMLVFFKPTNIFDRYTNSYLVKSKLKYGHYACQIVFLSTFDYDRLIKSICAVGAEANIAPKECCLYMRKDVNLSNIKQQDSQTSNFYRYQKVQCYNFKKDSCKWNHYKVAFDVVYHDNISVVWAYLPGTPWDGTSCFNFVKEVISVYHGNKPANVYDGYLFAWNESIKKALNHPYHIMKHIAAIPYNIVTNHTAKEQQTQLALSKGNLMTDREMCFLNLSESDSMRLTTTLKQRNLKPMAVMMHAVVMAYLKVIGEYPCGISIQSSLHSYSFDNNKDKINNRYYIGDWLIGVYYLVRDKINKNGELEFFETMYHTLMHELKTGTGAVREAMIARTYSIVKGGPAPFQNEASYTGLNCLSDSILFNNYGLRTMEPESKIVSWNWTGPGKLCCNCININGHTCMSFASTILTLEEITEIRDETKIILNQYIKST
jgi:hypothetical protein